MALALLLAGAAWAQSEKDKNAAFAALVGADADATDAAPVDLAPWADGPSGLLVVAALEDTDANDEAETLGALRVGLVARRGSGFVLVASDKDADYPEPRREITPSTPSVMIDRAVFRIAPNETALGVDISETLTTSSTTAGASSLMLYRRSGAKLIPIFSAQTADSTIDKTGASAREESNRHIVRFTSHLTRGYYDLVVARPGARAGRTFIWNGSRYVAVHG